MEAHISEVTFEYPSDSRNAKAFLAAGIAGFGLVLYVWRFTPLLPGDLRNVGFGFWSVVLLLLALSSAVEVFRPVRRASWIRDGVFGWSASRCRPSAGEVRLAEITALRLDTSERHFTIVRDAGALMSVPEQCTIDALQIAREIVARQPSIELYVDERKVG
jgi:hypothetical protein